MEVMVMVWIVVLVLMLVVVFFGLEVCSNFMVGGWGYVYVMYYGGVDVLGI